MLATAGPELPASVVVCFRLSIAAHLALILGEASMGHPTAHAALAARSMTWGAWGHFFWVGAALCLLGLVFGATSPSIAAGAGLVGLLFYEHAFVQAGQSVPLA